MNILIIDFETTGLIKPALTPLEGQPKIIEIGFCLATLPDLTILDSANILINPGEPISEEITKITGIRTEDVSDAPSFKEGSPPLKTALEQADVLCAHNLPFDYGMLMLELQRLKEEWTMPAQRLCTVQFFAHEWGRRMKLTELYEKKVGKKLEQTHRALDDVLALRDALNASQALHSVFPPS